MRRVMLIIAICTGLGLLKPGIARAQNPLFSSMPPGATAGDSQMVDGIAARIEDDILTEGEVRELSAFQILVDGKSKSRAEVIQELADQWILRGEATTAKYPMPSKEDVDRAYAQFVKQFPSLEEYLKRCTAVKLSEPAVRRILEQQLYLSRFIDYRFRPAAQIDQQQIEAYYNCEFVPQLKQRGENVPPLEDVQDTIREVLVQRDINDRADKWLEEARARLNIDILPDGGAQ